MSSNEKDGQPALVPKLRFPEFRGTEGWRENRLDAVLSPIVRERVKPSEPYLGLGLRSHGKGTFLKPQEDPTKNSMDLLYEVKCADLIVNITFAWEGAVAIAQVCDEGALVSHRFPTYTFEQGLATPEFFRYIILQKRFVNNLGVISPGGAGRNRVLSKNDFLKLLVALPSPAEQQKIAECLGSLDEVLAAQTRKVDAHKTHKKGLMQQLFPREGETQPRLRFPEFQNDGEWKKKTLGQIADFQSGGTPSKAIPAFWNGSVPWVSAKDMKQLFLEDAEDHISAAAVNDGAKLVPAGTLLMLVRGMTLLKDVPICVLCQEMSFNQDVKALRPKEDVDGLFLALLLTGSKDRLLEMVSVAGHGTGKLDTDELKAMELLLPRPAEQHRVGSCLSSLDALITAETQKLEALKHHKRGLMQQLLPSTEDVEA